MRYAILLVLIITLAAACKKDNANSQGNSNNNTTTYNTFPGIVGVYTGTEICYSPHNTGTYVIDTLNNQSWTVALVGDSTITVNGALAKFQDVYPNTNYFSGVDNSGNDFGVGFDSLFHTTHIQTSVGTNVCISNGTR